MIYVLYMMTLEKIDTVFMLSIDLYNTHRH